MQDIIHHFTAQQQNRALYRLVILHIIIIALSNYLVQFPFTINIFNQEIHSTWGAFSFPFIFLATDLTVRIFGRDPARRIIFRVMFPALILSYIVSVVFSNGQWQGWAALSDYSHPVFRIALASFAAYTAGQLLDIAVFDRLRRRKSWWVAPAASTFLGNALDTLLFFAIAFHMSQDAFMAANWPHIAWVDYLSKLVIGTLFFLPAYGILLTVLSRKITAENHAKLLENQS